MNPDAPPTAARPSAPTRLQPEHDPAPYDLHLEGALDSARFEELLASGRCLRFPWYDVDALAGPLLPGFLALFGARAKQFKSTFLLDCFTAWVDLGKRVMLVGTEQSAGVLKRLYACHRLQISTRAALDVSHPRHDDVLEDVHKGQGELADLGIIVGSPDLTLATFKGWARYGWKLGVDALILDHFHRLEGEAGEEQGKAIREIKNIAAKGDMVLLAAAQLKQGEGGVLGNFEVPGAGSWAGTAGLQRECDLALQGWRPFRLGITTKQKREAKEHPDRLGEIVEPNMLAVKQAASRYGEEVYTVARLHATDGRLESWSPKTPGLFS